MLIHMCFSLTYLCMMCDPAIPWLGIYPEKTVIHTDTCTRMFMAALFAIARTWKQPKCPLTDEWIKKMWYIYIYNGILLSHQRNHIGSFVEMDHLNHFSVCSSFMWSTFSLCIQVPKLFSSYKTETLYPLKKPHSSLPLATTILLSVSINLSTIYEDLI